MRLTGRGLDAPVVLALAPGGVTIGDEIARALHGSLDVAPVAAVGAPGRPELTIAAVAMGSLELRDVNTIDRLNLDPSQVDQLGRLAQTRLSERLLHWRDARALPIIEGRCAIIVSDICPTGLRAAVAIYWLCAHHPEEVVVACAACSPAAVIRLRVRSAAELVTLATPGDPAELDALFVGDPLPEDQAIAAILSRYEQGEPAPLMG
jgi:predicted phosphoribosyltransferase